MNANPLSVSIALLFAVYLPITHADAENSQNDISTGQIFIAPAQAQGPVAETSTSLKVLNNSSDPIYAIQQGSKYTVASKESKDLDYANGIVTLSTTQKESGIKFVNFEGRGKRCPASFCLIVQ
ncbi:hypothetical protein ACXR0M_10015 [Pseudomonas sp. Eth.TT006]